VAKYVIFHRSTDPSLTRQASTTAKGLGLTVHSAKSGALLVTGEPAQVRAAVRQMPGGDWECAVEKTATTLPEKRPQPHRRLRAGG
jgi:hypothetical protein